MELDRRGMLKLSIGALLSATGCRAFTTTEGKVRVVPNNEIFFTEFRTYKGLAQEEAERQLVELAGTSELEEAWVYMHDEQELRETGFNETESSSQFIIYPWEISKGRNTFYHIHPKKTYLKIAKEYSKIFCKDPPKLEAALQMPGYSAPGVSDIQGFAKIIESNRYQRHQLLFARGPIDFAIADWEGVTTVELSARFVNYALEEPEKVREYLEALQPGFFTHLTNFESYRKELENIGVKIAYRQVKKIGKLLRKIEVENEKRENK